MSEKVEYRTPEEKEACDLIKKDRYYSRTMVLKKGITDRIEEIESYILSVFTIVNINKKTKVVSLASGLKYCGTFIMPDTHKKLICTNNHAINRLKQVKNMYKKDRRERIRFNETIEKNITLSEIIYYYKDMGTIGFYSYFWHNRGEEIKYIEEQVI